MQVRRAIFGDESQLRSLRLQAMIDSPSAFGSTHERELARSTNDWRHWIEPNPTFLLQRADDVDEGTAIGIVAGALDIDEPGVAQLLAMWVHPSARGSGGADLLVNAVIDWARASGARLLRLWVTDGNASAIHLYERNGFVATGREKLRDRDGRGEAEMGRPL